MLVEFRVKNFLSIQDEQVLSLVASNDKEFENTHTFPINDNLKLLKSSTIYGANASGKTNVIKALFYMREIVEKSSEAQSGAKLPVTPFLLGNNDNEPTEFEITIFAKETQTRYQYGFSATKERIYDEWLFAFQNNTNRAQKWFFRSYNEKTKNYDWDFGANLKGAKKLWQTSTRDNALFLSTATSLNSKQLQPIISWFNAMQISGSNGFANGIEVSASIINDYDKKNGLINLFKVADFDIENISVTQLNSDDDIANPVKKNFVIKFFHQNQNKDKIIPINLIDESDGTRYFFNLIGPFINTLVNGGVIVADELHNHLHPLMTQFLINLFHNPKINVSNAQLIFTTHETSVLKKEIFRKDQVYFCEKNNKATQIYSLAEFKLRKDAQDWEKSYLLGRFGALPYFADICNAMEINNAK